MSRSTRNLHVWKTRTDDGRRRQVSAKLFGAKWTFTSRCEDEDDWITHDPPLLDDLEELHGILFRKYQRKHLSWEVVESVRKLIDARRS